MHFKKRNKKRTVLRGFAENFHGLSINHHALKITSGALWKQ